MFWNIHDDLGVAAQRIKASSPISLMTYGYARRVAMAALYVQGVNSSDDYGHVKAMFKGIQKLTTHTVEFQEQAFALAIEFMQSYSPQITALFAKQVVAIAEEYELPEQRLTDPELFAAVVETTHQEAMAKLSGLEAVAVDNFDAHEISAPINHHKATDSSPTISINDILKELSKLSESPNQKHETIWIQPLNEPWSLEFHCAKEDIDRKDELLSRLYELLHGAVQMSHFPFRGKDITS